MDAPADVPSHPTHRRLVTAPADHAGRTVVVCACASTAMHHGAFLHDCDDPHLQLVVLDCSRELEAPCSDRVWR